MTLDTATRSKLARAAVKANRWAATRDALIVEAVTAGGTLRDVAAAASVSHQTVANIVARTPSAEAVTPA